MKQLVFYFILIISIQAKAQFPIVCVDSNRINPFYNCNDPYFRPVCGCNNKTYKTDCVGRNVYGINYNISDGVCKNDVFEFDFYPNPASENLNFAIEFFDQGNIQVWIFDVFGHKMQSIIKSGIKRYDELIDVSGYKTGVYFIGILSGSVYKVRKFVVR